MARLPTKEDLGGLPAIATRPAVSLQGGEAVGKGIASLGGALSGIAEDQAKQDDALGLIKAEADFKSGMYGTLRSFDEDPNYQTYGPRFDEATGQTINNAAANIPNAYSRQRWIEKAQGEAPIFKDRVLRRGTSLARQDQFVQVDDALRKQRDAYNDPNADDAARAETMRSMEATIEAAKKTGLLDPLHARKLRDEHIGGAQVDDAEKRMWSDPEGLLEDLNAYRPPQAAPSAPPTITPLPGKSLGRGARNGAIEGVVIHHTSGSTLDGALSQGRMTGTGANYYVDRDGSVYQGAPEDQYTAHIQPPDSKYRNGANPNLSSQNTVGIEVVAKDDGDVTPEQRATVRALTSDIVSRNGIKPENVVGHGEIQGGPGGNREDNEGVASAQEYRDNGGSSLPRRSSGTEVAQANTGTASDVTKEDLPDIVPPSRYDRLTPHQHHALITRARQALSETTQQAVKDDLARMDHGEDPQPDAKGRTSLQRAALVLTPNQYNKLERFWNEKQMAKSAVYGDPTAEAPAMALPLSDLNDGQAAERIAKLTPAKTDAESYQSAARVQDKVEKAYSKIQDWRTKDPAQAVTGGRVGGSAGNALSVDENGQVQVNQGDDTDLRSRPAPEVSRALAMIRGKIPSVALTQDDQGGVTIANQDKGDPRQVAYATKILTDARLAAQQRLGVPTAEQRMVTLGEAQQLLGMRTATGLSLEEFETNVNAAKQKAAMLYGPDAKRALSDSVRLITKDQQKRQVDTDVATGLLNGTLSADKLFPQQSTGFFGFGGRPPQSYAEQAAPSANMTQLSPAPFDPWLGGSPSITRPYAPPNNAGGAEQPTPVPGITTSTFPTPSEAHVQWLDAHNDAAGRTIFDAKFGRGAAQRYLQK